LNANRFEDSEELQALACCLRLVYQGLAIQTQRVLVQPRLCCKERYKSLSLPLNM
jgi:hypothetical protein